MGTSSSSRAPAASRSNTKKQQGECAGGRKATDVIVCETFTGTDNEYDSSVEKVTSFEILSEDESDSSCDEGDVFVDEEELALVLAEAIVLKKAAVDYAHPELGVVTLDGAVCGRNYFNRLSAPEVEVEDIKEQAQMLADVRALKKAAVDYAHPEVEVVTSDPSVYGRNYFNRVSAPEVEDEDIEERAFILAEAIALKKAAVDYAHPEFEVSGSDPSVYGRNHFNRFSAPEFEVEDIEEYAQVLVDMRALKKAAVDYAHPEVEVVTLDSSVYGRNYFNRVSAPELEDEDIEEKAMILAEAIALKKAAVDYAHPEFEVSASDPSVYGRNYFNRLSAPEVEVEDIEEQAQVLADVRALKKAAVDYAHPEAGVMTSDPSVYGCNYFNRVSVPEVEDEDMEEKAMILVEAIALKKAAVDYAHPEFEVTISDPSVYGRNYFNRLSAPEFEVEDIEEQAQVLVDARALKKAAVDYAHPEFEVITSDPSVYGRNYFSCFSAPEVEDIEEKAIILAEATALKKAAVGYAHPEVGVVTSDPSVYGHNYYNRYGTDHPAVSTVSTMQYPSMRKERAMSNVSETFEFDDDIFNHMREEFQGMEDFNVKKVNTLREEESQPEDEGKLSRSPSSVMLFGFTGY